MGVGGWEEEVEGRIRRRLEEARKAGGEDEEME
jgi:hypothetical protein